MDKVQEQLLHARMRRMERALRESKQSKTGCGTIAAGVIAGIFGVFIIICTVSALFTGGVTAAAAAAGKAKRDQWTEIGRAKLAAEEAARKASLDSRQRLIEEYGRVRSTPDDKPLGESEPRTETDSQWSPR